MGAAAALTVEFDRSGGNLVAYLVGELDLATSAVLTEEVISHVDQHTRRVVLDLAMLNFCDCVGLRVLMSLDHYLETYGVTVVLRDPCRSFRRMLEVTGADERLSILGVGPDR